MKYVVELRKLSQRESVLLRIICARKVRHDPFDANRLEPRQHRERVGYGGTHTARKTGERIGVVPAGYADGVPRALSNLGHVIVAGLSCPIVGAVSMDSMTIDLTACPTAAVGSDVLIYGRHGDWDVPLEEVAQAIGTIPYELMIRRGPRVQRILTRH